MEVLDSYKRPLDPGFFTGFPAFYELKYKIFTLWEAELARPVPMESRYKLDLNTNEDHRMPTIVKKTVMEELLSEKLSDEQVRVCIIRCFHK